MEHSSKDKSGLPSNAYRELAAGEKYIPVVTAEQKLPEVTLRSVFWGIFFGIIFSAGTTFLTLKIAQGLEASIPIAIIAVGLAYLYKRRSSILENVMIQSIGSAAPAAAGGMVFVVPALYILKLDNYISFFMIFFSFVVGGFLGILYLIPFRKHYVSEMHGKYPFPEATATTEVLIAGKEGGQSAKVLAYSVAIGGIYDFLCMTLGGWREVFTTKLIPTLSLFTNKLKIIFDLNIGAAVLGMGYIIGIRYCLILGAASFLSFFILVPFVAHFGSLMPGVGGKLIGDMVAGEIFTHYVRFIGIGVIAMAAVLGVLKSLKIMVGAIREGLKEMFYGHHDEGKVPRINKDMKMSFLLMILISVLIAVFIYFRWQMFGGQENAGLNSLLALIIVSLISFIFTTVAIWCIAVTARNPVSGMTIVTLAITGVCFTAMKIAGKPGVAAAVTIGTIVCTALSVSGSFITDLKTGYWLGSTPRNQQRWKFVGVLTGAFGVAAVVIILNEVYGFASDGANPLPAPQANAMAAVLQMVMGEGQIPWMMYIFGAVLAILFEMLGVPPLAAGLGMYLPMNLNMSILVGGVLSHIVSTSGRTPEIGKKRGEKGTLIASGFIAGGAIVGVVGAIMMYIQQTTGKVFLPDFGFGGDNLIGNYVALLGMAMLCLFILWDTRRVNNKS